MPLRGINKQRISYPVDIGATLADIPVSVLLAFAALDLQESGVFVLVSQTSLEAGKHGLGVQSS